MSNTRQITALKQLTKGNGTQRDVWFSPSKQFQKFRFSLNFELKEIFIEKFYGKVKIQSYFIVLVALTHFMNFFIFAF